MSDVARKQAEQQAGRQLPTPKLPEPKPPEPTPEQLKKYGKYVSDQPKAIIYKEGKPISLKIDPTEKIETQYQENKKIYEQIITQKDKFNPEQINQVKDQWIGYENKVQQYKEDWSKYKKDLGKYFEAKRPLKTAELFKDFYERSERFDVIAKKFAEKYNSIAKEWNEANTLWNKASENWKKYGDDFEEAIQDLQKFGEELRLAKMGILERAAENILKEVPFEPQKEKDLYPQRSKGYSLTQEQKVKRLQWAALQPLIGVEQVVSNPVLMGSAVAPTAAAIVAGGPAGVVVGAGIGVAFLIKSLSDWGNKSKEEKEIVANYIREHPEVYVQTLLRIAGASSFAYGLGKLGATVAGKAEIKPGVLTRKIKNLLDTKKYGKGWDYISNEIDDAWYRLTEEDKFFLNSLSEDELRKLLTDPPVSYEEWIMSKAFSGGIPGIEESYGPLSSYMETLLNRDKIYSIPGIREEMRRLYNLGFTESEVRNIIDAKINAIIGLGVVSFPELGEKIGVTDISISGIGPLETLKIKTDETPKELGEVFPIEFALTSPKLDLPTLEKLETPSLGELEIPSPPPQLPPPEKPEPTPPPIPPPIILPKKTEEKIRKIRLQLYMGPKEKYRVRYTYPRGKGETLTVEARGFPDAVQKAQMIRRSNKYLPSVVDVVRI